MWSTPAVTGTPPPHLSNFTFTLIDSHHAVLFGGDDASHQKGNSVFILDLEKMVNFIVHSYCSPAVTPFSTKSLYLLPIFNSPNQRL